MQWQLSVTMQQLASTDKRRRRRRRSRFCLSSRTFKCVYVLGNRENRGERQRKLQIRLERLHFNYVIKLKLSTH